MPPSEYITTHRQLDTLVRTGQSSFFFRLSAKSNNRCDRPPCYRQCVHLPPLTRCVARWSPDAVLFVSQFLSVISCRRCRCSSVHVSWCRHVTCGVAARHMTRRQLAASYCAPTGRHIAGIPMCSRTYKAGERAIDRRAAFTDR